MELVLQSVQVRWDLARLLLVVVVVVVVVCVCVCRAVTKFVEEYRKKHTQIGVAYNEWELLPTAGRPGAPKGRVWSIQQESVQECSSRASET